MRKMISQVQYTHILEFELQENNINSCQVSEVTYLSECSIIDRDDKSLPA